jgi:hypothetical protein
VGAGLDIIGRSKKSLKAGNAPVMVVGAPVDDRALNTRSGHLTAFLIGKAASCIVAVSASRFYFFTLSYRLIETGEREREREKLNVGLRENPVDDSKESKVKRLARDLSSSTFPS